MAAQVQGPTAYWYPTLAADSPSDAAPQSPDESAVASGFCREELDHISTQDLRKMLQEREVAIVKLREEMSMLRSAPRLFRDRLLELEQGVLGRVKAGAVVELNAPVLHGISDALRVTHALQHDTALEHRHALRDGHPHHDRDLHSGLDGFVLGRGYMKLDQKEIAHRRRKAELEANKHPTIKEFHYAGHVALPGDQLPPPFNGQDLTRDGFWLEPPSTAQPHESPERWAFRHDKPGDAEDALAIDWLGIAKRGLPAEKSLHARHGGPPRWLY